jgi:PEP-CTERM motif-containing protein
MVRKVVRAASVAAVLSLTVLTTQARAATITLGLGLNQNPADVIFSAIGGNPPTLMTATLDFLDVDITTTTADFQVKVTNNTNSAFNQRVHSIGFNTDPNPATASMTTAGSVFTNVSTNDNFPSFHTVDVCLFSPNQCSGGGQPGNLAEGASDTFTFRLTGTFTNGITLNGFAIKFQGDLGSFEFGDTPPGEPPPVVPPVTVPEPASMLLVGLGFAASLAGARRRNN